MFLLHSFLNIVTPRKIEDFRTLSSLRTLRRKYSMSKSRDLLSFIPQVQKIGIDKSCIKSSFLEAVND